MNTYPTEHVTTNRTHYTPSGLGVIHELDSGRCPSEPSRLGDILSPTLELSRPSVAIRRTCWSDYRQQGCDGNTGLDPSRPHALLPLGLGWRYSVHNFLMTICFPLFPLSHVFPYPYVLLFHLFIYLWSFPWLRMPLLYYYQFFSHSILLSRTFTHSLLPLFFIVLPLEELYLGCRWHHGTSPYISSTR